MLNLFEVVDSQVPNTENIIVELINGKKAYRLVKEGEDLAKQKVLKGRKVKFDIIKQSISTRNITIVSISEGPDLVFQSLKDIGEENNIVEIINGEVLELNDETIIIFKPTSTIILYFTLL